MSCIVQRPGTNGSAALRFYSVSQLRPTQFLARPLPGASPRQCPRYPTCLAQPTSLTAQCKAKRKREGDDAAEGSDDSSVEVFDVEAIRGKRKTRVRLPRSSLSELMKRRPATLSTSSSGQDTRRIRTAGSARSTPSFPFDRPFWSLLIQVCRNLQCPEKLEEFNEAQRQKAAAKRARVPGSKTSGDDNSGSGAAIARSPVKSEGTGKDDAAAGRSPVLAKEKKSLENGDEIERIMGAKRNQLTSELELYIKWCAACTAFSL